MAQQKTFTVPFQGTHITCFRSGNRKGMPVVLLHGFCEDSRMWEEWLTYLPDTYAYYLIDLPGFGQSGLPGDLSIESMADAVASVLESLNIQTCVLTGHSMGGYVACAFAEKYGNQLAGLCLFHSHPFADDADKKEGRLKSVEFIEQNGHVLYVRHLIPKLFSYDYTKGYQAEVNRMIYYATQYDPAAIIAALHAMRNRPDRSEVLKNIGCPVLFLIGQKDTAVPYHLSLAQTHLPDRASIELFPDVGHMGMFKAPRETARAFRQFLTFL